MAAALSLLVWRARRFYIEHLVFATHVLSFSFLLSILLWPIYAVVGVSIWSNARFVMAASLVMILVYMIFALRRVYGQGWGRTLAKGMILYVIYFGITGAITVACLGAALFVVARSAPQ